MNRTITVTGTGSATVAPDLIRITFSLNRLLDTYELTMNALIEDTARLTENLTALGYAKSDVKTLDLGVRPHHESYKGKDGNYHSRFLGYKGTHKLRLDFDFDSHLLGTTIRAIVNSGVDPDFSIDYGYKDTEALKNMVIVSAVEDSCRKAQLLAKAAGTTLGEVQSIDYSWNEIDIYHRIDRDYVLCAAEMAQKSEIEITPDDIRSQDTVTIIWSLV